MFAALVGMGLHGFDLAEQTRTLCGGISSGGLVTRKLPDRGMTFRVLAVEGIDLHIPDEPAKFGIEIPFLEGDMRARCPVQIPRSPARLPVVTFAQCGSDGVQPMSQHRVVMPEFVEQRAHGIGHGADLRRFADTGAIDKQEQGRSCAGSMDFARPNGRRSNVRLYTRKTR